MRDEATPEETLQLAEWMDQPDFHSLFADYSRRLWQQSRPQAGRSVCREVWRAVACHLGRASRCRLLLLSPAVLRIAVAILLPVCIGLSAWLAFGPVSLGDRSGEVCEMVVDQGQKATLTLPDGTKVWMNSASRLKYDGNYNRQERRVQLEGEAYFEVAPDAEKKFTVCCGGLNVEALGTAFNVKGYRDDKYVTTSLLEGSVKVYNQHCDIRLNPNQSLQFDREGQTFLKTSFTDSREIDFWRRNILYFRSATLGDIARTLERMYCLDIRFESEDLKQIVFSGGIRNNSLTNVFHIISLTYPLSYSMEKDVVTIRHI